MNKDIPLDEDTLTAGQIAAKLGRSTYGVKKALRRLGIEPVEIRIGIKFYPPDAAEQLEEGMRQPNGMLL